MPPKPAADQREIGFSALGTVTHDFRAYSRSPLWDLCLSAAKTRTPSLPANARLPEDAEEATPIGQGLLR